MYEQEKQREINLLLLLVYTLLIMVLTAESFLMGWEIKPIVQLLLGVAVCWWLHMTEKVSAPMRVWICFILSMLAFFFYGTHETSIYDLAPVMILIMILYSAAEEPLIIKICVITYILTMCYDFMFVIRGAAEFSVLMVTRTMLHILMVSLSGYLLKSVLSRRSKERKITNKKIVQLEETNRSTEDFLANVSHELRTPINAVTGITAVMLKNEDDAEKVKDLLAIQAAGHRLFGQIGDILDYTEIDTGRIKVSEDTYMISSLINDVIIGSRLPQRENAPELIFDIDAGIPAVLLGDEKKIKKILEHLIDNAFKFTKKGGICVRAYARRKSYGINLCISVSDTGIGISKEELKKIKDRFYQSNAGRNRRAGGLGLGLPIVYGMVSAMEGFIQIQSTVGQGTTVSVSIPQKVSDGAPAMVVENREDLCLACYLSPEKYKVPEVRDYYDDMISHLVQGLDVTLHRVTNIDDLRKLTSVYKLTHLFIAGEEYEENQAYFEDLEPSIKVIVAADEDFVLPQGSRVKLLKKPFYCLPIVNILNAGASEDEALFKEKRMICPDVRVLVVDDEPMNLMVAEGIFRDYQMSVTTAESGRKAVELCETEEFDLVFLDHMMPEMDGVETLKQLRRNNAETGRELTIIAFTANAVSGAREMFLQEGFDEFISKPVEPLEMERILRKVLPKSSVCYVDENDIKALKAGNPDSQKVGTTDGQVSEKRLEQNTFIRLESVGIHTHSGLQYCGGDRQFYVELLTKFATDAGRKETEINGFFKQEDFKNYGIMVHALKSTAKMVGADSLSENARRSEAAAKNHDADYIREHHEELLDEYQQIVQGISDVLQLSEDNPVQEEQGDKSEISREDLLYQLEKLKGGLDTFEADKAEAVMAEISGSVYEGASVGGLLYNVRQDVNDFEFASASEKVEALMKKVEGGEAG